MIDSYGWLKRLTSRVKTLETTGASPVFLASATTPVTVTAAQALQHAIITNTKADGAVEFDLPVPTVGMRVTAIAGIAGQNITLDQPAGSVIDGTATDGQSLSADALGESIELVCVVAGRWAVNSKTGTWTAA